jgi:hypothetical protein
MTANETEKKLESVFSLFDLSPNQNAGVLNSCQKED